MWRRFGQQRPCSFCMSSTLTWAKEPEISSLSSGPLHYEPSLSAAKTPPYNGMISAIPSQRFRPLHPSLSSRLPELLPPTPEKHTNSLIVILNTSAKRQTSTLIMALGESVAARVRNLTFQMVVQENIWIFPLRMFSIQRIMAISIA